MNFCYFKVGYLFTPDFYLNEEVNCSEPLSPSISIPRFKQVFPMKYD
jgi:hypothetical protein